MIKKTFLQLSTLVVLVLVAVMLNSCEKHDEVSSNNQVQEMISQTGSYNHLYDTGYIQTRTENLSAEDLAQLHTAIASVYQVRSQLKGDWKHRKDYPLNPKLFENEHIYKYMTMYLYECVRYLSPEEQEYTKPLPYIESIQIISSDIMKKDNLYLIPVKVDDRDYLPEGINPNDWGREDVYEQFFIFTKINNNFVITNFITGYLYDKDSEVYTKISKYSQEDWNKSTYNREKLKTRSNEGFLRKYLDFIEGDMTKEEYQKSVNSHYNSKKI